MAKDSPPRGILMRINHNQKLPEVEKKVCLDRMYIDKHLQRFAHVEVEPKSVE
jgi:hypothetical protein